MKNMTRGDLAVLLAFLSLAFFMIVGMLAGRAFFATGGCLSLLAIFFAAIRYRENTKH